MIYAMRKLSMIFILTIFSLIACDQAVEEVAVTYMVTDSDSGFDVRYRNTDGELVSEKVTTDSETDVWKYVFEADPGEIVFISANYYDVNSKIRVQIMLDGKIFREASSRYDTTDFVVVSGTVPW
jgi:hypothetical protein